VVVPGSGLLVAPDDPVALAAAIRRVLADPALARDLVTGGTARAASLSWHAAAEAHVPVYAAAGRP
ncbi:MAG TPA: glycogen synthase, partial [Euzebya sp.]|nr:glycogen synthase [Euzebya sp.]